MKDFTKIKLINSLIDVVDRFYELKNENDIENSSHLKGFCEGMAYSMIELKFITSSEAKKILSGLGEKLDDSVEIIQDESEVLVEVEKNQKKESKSNLNEINNELEIDDIHPKNSIFISQQKLDNFDIPTYIRKKRD